VYDLPAQRGDALAPIGERATHRPVPLGLKGTGFGIHAVGLEDLEKGRVAVIDHGL